MRSLRARLTLSYAALFAAALIVAAALLSRYAFDALAHPTLDAMEVSNRIAETIVAAHPHAPPAAVERLIQLEAQRDGVAIRLPPPNRHSPAGSSPEIPRGIDNLNLLSLLGARQHVVHVAGDIVVITPDYWRLRSAVNAYFETLGAGIVLAVLIAWLVARWITGQAIRPLLTVTAELRRFAGGDFTPRVVRTADRAELGSLIDAYNGAAEKVAAAFEERRAVEEHIRRFVADAGHELRTPLTVIDGYVQILRKAKPDDATDRERAFATLQAQTARMRALVERLMLLARLERPDLSQARTPVEVAEIARDAIADVTSARGGNVALANGDPGAVIVGDPGDLHEAIGNLVDNAVKYGANTPVTVTLSASEDAVVVRVRDGGPGIPPEERARIFERFFRGDGRGAVEGSGLGLAIVERAAARCGGRVVLERAEPGDTVFALHFPAARPRARDRTPLEV